MSGSITPTGNGFIEWVASGGSADSATTDGSAYALAATTIPLANAGTGSFSAGKRIKFNGDDNYYTLKYGVSDVSGSGLATSATTDATGYAIGLSSVTLAAAGTGAALKGNVITFAGDATQYTITSGLNSVAVGGSITFTPALVQAIPAATTAITCYNALTLVIGLRSVITAGVLKKIYSGGELKRANQISQAITATGAFTSAVSNDTGLPWFKTGQIAQFEMDKGYSALSVKSDNIKNRSKASSGVSQTRMIHEGEMYRLSIEGIEDIRANGNASDFESILSMLEAFDAGILLAWFPDFAARPTEFYYCTLESRSDMKREGKLNYHSVDLTLMVETGETVSIPSFG